MSLAAYFHLMDTTRPHLWWISCELCHGTDIAQLQWNKAVCCSECDRQRKIRIVVYPTGIRQNRAAAPGDRHLRRSRDARLLPNFFKVT